MASFVIGLCGYAGAGKDTFAEMLAKAAQARGLTAGCFSFAQPMRNMLLALGVLPQYMLLRELKEEPVPGFGLSYRHLAQTLGTEWGRKCNGEAFWLRATAVEVEKYKLDVSIISDVRFPNEAAWVNERPHGFLFRLVRGVTPVRAHESEAYVETLPAINVYNGGSLKDLEAQAEIVISRVLDSRQG